MYIYIFNACYLMLFKYKYIHTYILVLVIALVVAVALVVDEKHSTFVSTKCAPPVFDQKTHPNSHTNIEIQIIIS